jgi:uncharacterized protein (TIGR03435 family)
MTNRITRPPNRTKHHLLIATALAALTYTAITNLHAQPSPATPPEFDAVSIKPGPPPPGGRPTFGYPGSLAFTPGTVLGRSVTAGRIIIEAYRLHDYQLSGGPAWLAADRFALEAKSDSTAAEDQQRLMLQTALSKRFRLVAHRETKEMSVWALIVAKGGSKLHDLKPGEPVPSSREELDRLRLIRTYDGPLAGTMIDSGNIQTLADQLYSTLSRSNNGADARPVLNQTGLTGNYLFFMQWGQNEDLKDVVEEVTGLKLEPRKAPVEVSSSIKSRSPTQTKYPVSQIRSRIPVDAFRGTGNPACGPAFQRLLSSAARRYPGYVSGLKNPSTKRRAENPARIPGVPRQSKM